MSWTDERVNALMRMWVEGKSATQISSEIGGVSRNAVIGKVHRLGIAMRNGAGVRIDGAKRPALVSADIVPLKSQAAPKTVAKVNGSLENKVRQGVAQAKRSAPHGILDLSEVTCRWPLGDPASPDFHFCGQTSVAGRPYCLEHMKAAYCPSRSQNPRQSGGQQAAYRQQTRAEVD